MKRILCMLMAILMLISCAPLLFSCKDEEKKTEGSGYEGGKRVDDGSIFYERSLVSDDLPDYDYNGREFRIVTHMPEEIIVNEDEKNKGDLIKDAKFARTKAVEDRFNVKIKVVYSGAFSEVSDYVSKTVLAASNEFDLLVNMSLDTGKLVLKKLFLNWYDIENVNFDKPWWATANKTDLTIGDNCPIAISDLNYTAITSTYCMIFNKNLASSYELGDIYGLVLDGKWTFDKLQEMIKDVYVDDGNDKRDEGDFYGLSHGNGSCINTYLWAFDNPVCKKGEDGLPEIVFKTEKMNGIVSDLYDMFFNTDGVYFDPTKVNEKSVAGSLFFEKRAIFIPATLGSPTQEKYRNFEDDYGIIPYPKYTEDQAEYKTMADGYHSVLAVPKTVKDTEFVGIITEALSAESWKTLTPTLYEIALKTRYLRDSESKEIMDIIIAGRTFDFGYIYDGWEGFSFILEGMMSARKNNFESEYYIRYNSAFRQYKSTIKTISNM